MPSKKFVDEFTFSTPKTKAFEWNNETNGIDDIELCSPMKLTTREKKEEKKTIKRILDKQKLKVNMEDVKPVTLTRLKNSGLSIPMSERLQKLVDTSEMDLLVVALAKYFDTLFQCLCYEELAAKSPFLPTIEELKQQEERKISANHCLLKAAEAYSNLLMIERTDYFETQRNKYSGYRTCDPARENYREHALFETIYWYLVFSVWVILNRERFKTISTEIGWFIRSEMFNSLGRVDEELLVRRSSRVDTITKLYERDLPRAKMISQHSPAFRILRRNPKDQSAYLFQGQQHDTDKRIAQVLKDADNWDKKDFNLDRVGILGDLRSAYDEMLIPEEEKGNKER